MVSKTGQRVRNLEKLHGIKPHHGPLPEPVLEEMLADLGGPQLRKAKFELEEAGIYEGYTYGDLWNGWDCPYFTEEVAKTMPFVKFDGTTFWVEDCDNEPLTFTKAENGLYAIGAWYFCWMEYEDEDTEIDY